MPFALPGLVWVWTGGYLAIGCVIAAVVWRASGELYRHCDLPWWARLLFPRAVLFRLRTEDITYGTYFWNRGSFMSGIGLAVITFVWPLRLAGSLLGWGFILGADGIAYCCGRGNRASMSRFP